MTAGLPARGRMHRDPLDTEREAAEMAPKFLRDHVLELLRAAPFGLTDDEGGELLSLRFTGDRTSFIYDRLTFARRRQELCAAGLAEGTDVRRASPRGRKAIVWRAVPQDGA